MTAPALLGRHLARTPGGGRGLAARLLASDLAARLLPLAAAGELVMDKLPFLPPRTELPSLAGRAATGTLCGAAVAQWRGGATAAGAVAGAVAGGLAAVGASFAAYHLRRAAGEATGLPDPVVAVAEDAVALAAGAALAGAV